MRLRSRLPRRSVARAPLRPRRRNPRPRPSSRLKRPRPPLRNPRPSPLPKRSRKARPSVLAVAAASRSPRRYPSCPRTSTCRSLLITRMSLRPPPRMLPKSSCRSITRRLRRPAAAHPARLPRPRPASRLRLPRRRRPVAAPPRRRLFPRCRRTRLRPLRR